MVRLLPLLLLASACGPRGPEWLRAQSWTTHHLYDVHGTGPKDVWAVGELGLALHYDGTTWAAVDTAVPATLYGVWAQSPSNVWVVGEGGVILRWNGSRFTRLANSPTTSDLKVVLGLSASDVYLAGSSASFHFNGASFTELGSSTGLRSASGTAATGLWAIDDRSDLVALGGGGFSPVAVGTAGSWTFVAATPTGIWVVAGVSYGTEKALVGSGGRWTPVDLPRNGTSGFDLAAGFGVAGGTWFVGGDGNIVAVDGTTPRVEAAPGYAAPDLHRVWGASADDVWAVGDDGWLLRRFVTPH